jgi:Spy/CpxP family protein refolding chaperone
MHKSLRLTFLAVFLVFAVPTMGAEPERLRPSVPEEVADAWERFQKALQEWGGRVWGGAGGRGSRENRPVISQILSHKEALELSADQVRKLEQLRDDFQRRSIRSEADLKIVEIDIAALLETEPVDMTKLEAKVREGEKLRGELRIARIRAIEQARAVLNSEQKKKFQDLDPLPFASRPPRAGQNPPAKEREPTSR